MAESAVVCKESEEVSTFGENHRIKLEKLKTEIEKMGNLGLWWDSRLSEEEKHKYFYFFSLTSTDKDYIMNEIQRYSELYLKIETISSQSFDEIEKLYDEMKEMLEMAKEEKKVTKSSYVYSLHKYFISSGIEQRIEKLKNAMGTNEFKKLKGNIDNIIKKEAEELGKEYREENAKLREENEKVMLEKEKIEEAHRSKLEKLKIESQNRIKEMEEKLKDSQKLVNAMEEKLTEEIEMRQNMEEKLRRESQMKAAEIEETLKQESQRRAMEMEQKFASRIKEIEQMKENYKRIIEEKIRSSVDVRQSSNKNLPLSELERSQSCFNINPVETPKNLKPNPVETPEDLKPDHKFKIIGILEN